MRSREPLDPRDEAATRSSRRGGVSLSEALLDIANDPSRERIAIGDLLEALQDRALAALLLIFALPNVIPLPPGSSSVLGAPLLFLSAQLALGRGPWLPRFICRRSMERTSFAVLIGRAAPWLVRAERSLRPRLTRWACPPVEYLIGLLCLFLAIVLVLPLPLGNMLPALAICLFALGILERDGLWVLAGLLVAVVATVLVSGVLFALVKAGFYLFLQLFGESAS